MTYIYIMVMHVHSQQIKSDKTIVLAVDVTAIQTHTSFMFNSCHDIILYA